MMRADSWVRIVQQVGGDLVAGADGAAVRARATGSTANHLDQMHYRQTGRYGRDQLPEDLSDKFTELLTTVLRLGVPVV